MVWQELFLHTSRDRVYGGDGGDMSPATFGRGDQLAVSAHQLAVSHLMVMQASLQDHCKFLSDNRECYKNKLSLFPVTA